MRYRVTFIAGLAIGYVLGAKAGQARYEQIRRAAHRISANPTARKTAGLVKTQVGGAGKAAYTRVTERMPITSARDFLARPTAEEADRAAKADGAARASANGAASGGNRH